MKKLKLFPKTFLYTFSLMIVIVAVSICWSISCFLLFTITDSVMRWKPILRNYARKLQIQKMQAGLL